MKKIAKEILKFFGYQLKKKDSGFTFNSDLKWLKEFNIKTIIDIGANEGQFAQFINLQFPESKIHSFEPIKSCFLKLVQLQKKINKLSSYNYGLGDVNTFIDFYVNDFTPSSSFLEMEQEHIKNFPLTKNTKVEKLQVRKIDDIYKDLEIENNVLVKIDVQGFEDKVIEGGNLFFKEIPKIVIVEASIVKLYHNEASFDYLFGKFINLGYQYAGNLHQLYSPINGAILQADAIFIK